MNQKSDWTVSVVTLKLFYVKERLCLNISKGRLQPSKIRYVYILVATHCKHNRDDNEMPLGRQSER